MGSTLLLIPRIRLHYRWCGFLAPSLGAQRPLEVPLPAMDCLPLGLAQLGMYRRALGLADQVGHRFTAGIAEFVAVFRGLTE